MTRIVPKKFSALVSLWLFLILAAAAISYSAGLGLGLGIGHSGLVVKKAEDIRWSASRSLPPGAEFTIIREDPITKGVEILARFPRGFKLPLHNHSHDETIVVVRGKLVIGILDQETVLGPGSYAFLPAHTPHTLRTKGWRSVVLKISMAGPYSLVKPK